MTGGAAAPFAPPAAAAHHLHGSLINLAAWIPEGRAHANTSVSMTPEKPSQFPAWVSLYSGFECSERTPAGQTDRQTGSRHGDRSSFLWLIKFHLEAAQRSIKTITASN